jgi:DNA-binding NarL/FixJ family response regulator
MLAGIRVLAAGDALLAPSVTRRLIREFVDRPEQTERPSPAFLEPLSSREKEVLIEVAGGRPTPRSGFAFTLSVHGEGSREPTAHET